MMRILRNATLSTAARVQAVLEAADEPLTRYQVFHRLDSSVNYQVIDSVLDYFAQLGLVTDEGKGGRAAWKAPRPTQAGPRGRAKTPVRVRHGRIRAAMLRRAGTATDRLLRDMPPSEVPPENLERMIKAPTRTSYLMWRDRTPADRLRASFALTAFAVALGEGRRREPRA